MSASKRIICLANSRKEKERCVAGVEVIDGRPAGWIRPVSDPESQKVLKRERQYKDGSDPSLLDIIDVPVLEPHPKDYQQENWLLNPKYRWNKVSSFTWDNLHEIADTDGTLWSNDCHTSNGLNDQIPLQEACLENHSLKLIHIDSMKLKVFAPNIKYGKTKRRVQGIFSFSMIEYALWVTDPQIERTYRARGDGEYQIGESYLTISLGEPYKDHCYKLIAAVLERPS